jgi:hypothetical protein
MKRVLLPSWQALCLSCVLIAAPAIAAALSGDGLLDSLDSVSPTLDPDAAGNLTDSLLDETGNPLNEGILDRMIENGLLLEPTTGEILEEGTADFIPAPGGDEFDPLE